MMYGLSSCLASGGLGAGC